VRWVLIVCCLAVACASSSEPPKSKPSSSATKKPRKPRPIAGVGPRRAGARKLPKGVAELEAAKKLARDGDLTGAAAQARRAAELDPRLQEAYLLLGSLCSVAGDAPCARDAYRQGLEALPTASDLHHALGMLELEAGATADAVKSLEEAHRLTGAKNPDIASDLAYAYVFVKRLDDAERLAQQARKAAPKSFAAAYTLGEVLLRKGRPAEAVEAFEAALTISSTEPAAKKRLAAAHAANGAHAKALTIYDELRTGPAAKDPRVHAATAGVLLELGRAKDAVTAMESAVALAPKNRRLLELLLHTQEQAKDKKAARRTKNQLRKLKGN